MEVVLVLHNIRSLYNVGSIFRTAEATHVKKIYLTGITPAPLDRFGRFRREISKVALGAEKMISWEKQASASRVIKELRANGFKIFAVEQSKKSTPYYRMKSWGAHRGKSNNKVVLVFGNEVRGLPPFILKQADKILEIPMAGRKESLNVSVSAAIILFHLRYTA